MPDISKDKFPRTSGFERETYDKRKVIVFDGYEAIQQKDGSWNLIVTPGGHDEFKSKKYEND